MLTSLSKLGNYLKTQIQQAKINKPNLSLYKKVLQQYTGDDWKKFINIDQNTYHKEKVFECSIFDMYIITWNNNQESKIHNHASKGCLNKVLMGTLNETIYDKNLLKLNTNSNPTNHISYIDDLIGFHKIKNSDTLSVSLHIYSPPNFKTNYF